MAYTPAAQGGATTTSGSLSGGSGSASFPVPTSLGAPGDPARPRPERGDTDFAAYSHPTPATPPTFEDSTALTSKLYGMSQHDLANLQTQLKMAGYGNVLSTGLMDQATLSAYQDLLADTARYAATGGTGYTPDSLLASKVAARNAAALDPTNAAYTGPTTSTSSASAVNLADPLAARALVTNALKDHLGRNPKKDEIDKFTAVLHAYERANPTVTNSTTTSPGSGNPASSSQSTSQVTQNGADEAGFADAYAMGTQGRANEAGALTESRFVDVLHSLMSGR